MTAGCGQVSGSFVRHSVVFDKSCLQAGCFFKREDRKSISQYSKDPEGFRPRVTLPVEPDRFFLGLKIYSSLYSSHKQYSFSSADFFLVVINRSICLNQFKDLFN